MRINITIYLILLLSLFHAGTQIIQGNEDTAPWLVHESQLEGAIPFIQNNGQWKSNIKYKADIRKGHIYFLSKSITYHFYEHPINHPFIQAGVMGFNEQSYTRHHVIKMEFAHSALEPSIVPASPETYYHNYFLGNDTTKWASHVPLYNKLSYEELYPGIALKVLGLGGQLKYEYHVSAEASPSDIQLRIQGPDSLWVANGAFHMKTTLGTLIESPPYAYQFINDRKVIIPCTYTLQGNVLSYEFPEGYNKDIPLVIDPTLIFSTHTGSLSDNWGFTATFDAEGNAYAGGVLYALGGGPTDQYPITTGSYRTIFSGGNSDITISKFNPNGTDLVYSTFIGGRASEQPHSLIVNEQNQLWIFGRTNSDNFPVTPQAYQPTLNGGFDLYVAKLSADGANLLGSTYIGGSGDDGVNGNENTAIAEKLKYNYGDDARGEIVIDRQDRAFIASCTFSADFPVSANATQTTFGGEQDGCVLSLSTDLSGLIWATYVGGAGDDAAYGLRVGADNSVYVTGGTSSTDLVTTLPNSNQAGLSGSFLGGLADGFIMHYSPDGAQLIEGAYVGSSEYDQVFLIDIGKDENVYLSGQSLGNFPVINPPTGPVYVDPNAPQFIAKLSFDLANIIYSTTFGTPNNDLVNISPTAFLVDNCDNVYVTGWGGLTNSLNAKGGDVFNMPLTPDAIQSETDGSDLYSIVFSRDAQEIVYASYLGGIDTRNARSEGEHVDGGTSRFDKNGIVYHSVCAGCNGAPSFPATPGAFAPERLGGNCNLAIFKMDFELAGIEADFNAFDSLSQLIVPGEGGCAPFLVNFENQSRNGDDDFTNYIWDFGDGTVLNTEDSPSHVYTEPGVYEVNLIMVDSTSCNISDTVIGEILILGLPEISAGDDQVICQNTSITLNGSGEGSFLWSPTSSLSDSTIANPVASPLETTEYRLAVTDENGCIAQDTVEIVVEGEIDLEIDSTKEVCLNTTVTLNTQSPQNLIYEWSPAAFLDDPTSPNPTVINLSNPTTFTLRSTAENGCVREDSVRVTIADPPITEVEERGVVCLTGEVILAASGGETYNWSTGQVGEEISVFPTEPTIYSVQGFLGDCAGDTAIILVEPEARLPLAAFEIDTANAFAPFTTRFNNQSENADRFRWSISPSGDELVGDSVIYTFLRPGLYEVTLIAETGFGCLDTAIETIEVDKITLYVPSAFTPNEDGINSEFRIGYFGMEQVTTRIYSRWGLEIFSSLNPEIPWDGTYKGQEVPEGVYVYVIEAIGKNGIPFRQSGSITLIR